MPKTDNQSDTLTESLPPEIQARLDRLEQLEALENERKGQYQENTKRIEERAAKEIERRDARTKMLESHLLQSAAESAIREAKGNVEGLLPHVLPYLTITEGRGAAGVSISVRDGALTGSAGTVTELVDNLRKHPALGLLFENASPTSGFRAASEGVVRLTAAEEKDPRVYARLKSRREKGEIREVLDSQGRRLI